jgi:hypothetical protein
MPLKTVDLFSPAGFQLSDGLACRYRACISATLSKATEKSARQ